MTHTGHGNHNTGYPQEQQIPFRNAYNQQSSYIPPQDPQQPGRMRRAGRHLANAGLGGGHVALAVGLLGIALPNGTTAAGLTALAGTLTLAVTQIRARVRQGLFGKKSYMAGVAGMALLTAASYSGIFNRLSGKSANELKENVTLGVEGKYCEGVKTRYKSDARYSRYELKCKK